MLPDQPGVQAYVESAAPLGRARSRVLDEKLLREQFGRLGNTPYDLGGIELEIVGAPFAAASLLNDVRREAVARLQQIESEPHRRGIADPAHVLAALPARDTSVAPAPQEPQLHLLVRTSQQLEAALELRPASITLDYLDLYGLRPSLERVREAGIAVRVASPRILKPGEEKIADFLLRLDCPILVRSAGLLHRLAQSDARPELIGDFSLNAANSITAAELLDHGLTRITPTHDLNGAQVADLARAVGPGAVEAIAYQHLPVFHTEHCVFCRFLSTGTSYLDCGRPCEKHKVEVRDPSGRAHPVIADVGCRNTVFGAEAQEASAHLREWRVAGLAHFRLEFAHESPAEVRRVTDSFAEALAGRSSFEELTRTLRAIAPQGTTQGSLFVPRDYLTLPILQ
jgi:putative protease